MESLTVHPQTKEQLQLLVALFKEMALPFEQAELTNPYGPEFNAKMKRSEEEKKAGRYKVIKTEDLWK